MPQVQLDEQLYEEAKRRARAAGFASVDAFVAEQLTGDFAHEQEDFDDRFTPPVIAHLDTIFDQMRAGESVSDDQVQRHMLELRTKWVKNRSRERSSIPAVSKHASL